MRCLESLRETGPCPYATLFRSGSQEWERSELTGKLHSDPPSPVGHQVVPYGSEHLWAERRCQESLRESGRCAEATNAPWGSQEWERSELTGKLHSDPPTPVGHE